jgi:IS5 family transposase|tara:strand:+ start:703 stop:1161 length:459 start_codon:yes stop_codon:yes gene_type:complete
MRKRFEVQLALGAVPIEKLDFPTTREVTSAIMKSLQWIFITPEVNQGIFELLETAITPKQKKLGRKGMDLWTILVLGVFRLGRNFSYDELHDMANNHTQIKQLLGATHLDTELKFSLTALKENIPLLTEDLLAQINHIVASHGVTARNLLFG